MKPKPGDLADDFDNYVPSEARLNLPPMPAGRVQNIKARGGGRLECYGRSEQAYKVALAQKWLPSAPQEQLRLFLTYNDPTSDEVADYSAWTNEKLQERITALLAIPNLAVLPISEEYWADEVDSTDYPAFVEHGKTLMASGQLKVLTRRVYGS